MSDRPIRAVLFDFGGVLAEEGFRNGLVALAREQGLDAAELPRQSMAAIYDSGFVLGRGTAAGFWALLRERTGLSGEDTALSERILAGFVLRPAMLGLVRRLRRAGYLTAILSDQTHWLDELDARQPFMQAFDRVYNSYHLGKGKRDPSLFSDVAADMALPPASLLFVDDIPGNITRARAAGYQAQLFSDQETGIRTIDSSLRLAGHVGQLAGVIGERNLHRPRALQAAQDYITECWRTQGYEVNEQAYEVEGVKGTNLEITCKGDQRPDELILVGAHYDTVLGSPGANDNGSGVATLLELSRLLQGRTPACSIRLVAFANEEPPFFFTNRQGSLVYARAAKKRGDDIRLMIALETMGCFSDEPDSQQYPPLMRHFYPDKGNFTTLVSNLRSRRLMRRLAAAFREVSDFPLQHLATFSLVPGVAWSDHLSFWRQGYRALMVTDTAFYRYAYYHSADDTPDKLDYPRLAQVTAALAEAVCLLMEQRL